MALIFLFSFATQGNSTEQQKDADGAPDRDLAIQPPSAATIDSLLRMFQQAESLAPSAAAAPKPAWGGASVGRAGIPHAKLSSQTPMPAAAPHGHGMSPHGTSPHGSSPPSPCPPSMRQQQGQAGLVTQQGAARATAVVSRQAPPTSKQDQVLRSGLQRVARSKAAAAGRAVAAACAPLVVSAAATCGAAGAGAPEGAPLPPLPARRPPPPPLLLSVHAAQHVDEEVCEGGDGGEGDGDLQAKSGQNGNVHAGRPGGSAPIPADDVHDAVQAPGEDADEGEGDEGDEGDEGEEEEGLQPIISVAVVALGRPAAAVPIASPRHRGMLPLLRTLSAAPPPPPPLGVQQRQQQQQQPEVGAMTLPAQQPATSPTQAVLPPKRALQHGPEGRSAKRLRVLASRYDDLEGPGGGGGGDAEVAIAQWKAQLLGDEDEDGDADWGGGGRAAGHASNTALGVTAASAIFAPPVPAPPRDHASVPSLPGLASPRIEAEPTIRPQTARRISEDSPRLPAPPPPTTFPTVDGASTATATASTRGSSATVFPLLSAAAPAPVAPASASASHSAAPLLDAAAPTPASALLPVVPPASVAAAGRRVPAQGQWQRGPRTMAGAVSSRLPYVGGAVSTERGTELASALLDPSFRLVRPGASGHRYPASIESVAAAAVAEPIGAGVQRPPVFSAMSAAPSATPSAALPPLPSSAYQTAGGGGSSGGLDDAQYQGVFKSPGAEEGARRNIGDASDAILGRVGPNLVLSEADSEDGQLSEDVAGEGNDGEEGFWSQEEEESAEGDVEEGAVFLVDGPGKAGAPAPKPSSRRSTRGAGRPVAAAAGGGSGAATLDAANGGASGPTAVQPQAGRQEQRQRVRKLYLLSDGSLVAGGDAGGGKGGRQPAGAAAWVEFGLLAEVKEFEKARRKKRVQFQREREEEEEEEEGEELDGGDDRGGDIGGNGAVLPAGGKRKLGEAAAAGGRRGGCGGGGRGGGRDGQAPRREQYSVARALCRHWRVGRCLRGAECAFSHDFVPITKTHVPCK